MPLPPRKDWPAIFAELVELTYAAATEPEGWEPFLTGIARLCDGSAPTLFVHDAATNAVPRLWAVGMDPAYTRSFVDHYTFVSPWSARFNALPLQELIVTDAIFSRQRLLRTEFYRDWMRPQGWEFATGSILDRTDDRNIAIGINRWMPQSNDSPELAILRALVPHMRRSVRVARQIATAERRREAGDHALDHLRIAVLLVAHDARLVDANAAGRTMLSRQTGLRVDADGRVGGLRERDTENLWHLIRQTHDPAAFTDAQVVMLIPQRPPDGPLQVLAAALPGSSARSWMRGADVVLFIADPGASAPIAADRLQALYRLTPAETRVCSALLDGRSLSEIAEAFAVSKETVKSQIRAVFGKTGAKGQGDLIRLALRGVAELREDTPRG